MTNREFFTAIIEGKLTDEVKEFAEAARKKLDDRNATRSSKPSKTQLENAPIKQALLEFLAANDGKYTEGELGEKLNITHNKAGALARQLVAEGKVVSAEVKLPKVGKRKVYSYASDAIEVAEDESEE
jgi:predicted HTH transcriptional regulator